MQDRARVVVIGGGINGAALLYHLTLEGWSDVLLVEKAELISGSTWHGYPIELIGPAEAAELNPFYDFTDVKAAIWTEGEAHIDSTDATMAFIAGARANGASVIGHSDEAVGLTTSGGYSFTVEQSLAFAYVNAEHAAAGRALDVLILGQRRRAVVLDGPIWDPANTELLG